MAGVVLVPVAGGFSLGGGAGGECLARIMRPCCLAGRAVRAGRSAVARLGPVVRRRVVRGCAGPVHVNSGCLHVGAQASYPERAYSPAIELAEESRRAYVHLLDVAAS